MKKNLPPKGSRKDHYRKVFLGSNEKRGVLMSVVVYVLLITIAFIYLYPVLHMLSRSVMGYKDLNDSAAKWIPSSITGDNYARAISTMDYWNSLGKNLIIAVLPTLCQVFVCSMVGYGFARYKFPGKMLWMAILILSFLLPTQTTSLPNYILFSRWNLSDGTVKPFIITAILGMGFKSCLCILIFFNFHRQVPQSLIEAAEIDGAGHVKAYFQIAVPLSAAAIVVVTLFSFVWYWNEVDQIRTYFGGHTINTRDKGLTTLMLELNKFDDQFAKVYGSHAVGATSQDRNSQAVRMAGAMLAVAPMMVLYFVLQKQFVESVDKAGITGE